MQIIPLTAIAAQRLNVLLNNQYCTIKINQRSTGLFMDLYVNDNPLVLGILCRDRNKLVRYSYLGFSGELVFMDTQGEDDPYYTGLGDRFVLMYLEESDL